MDVKQEIKDKQNIEIHHVLGQKGKLAMGGRTWLLHVAEWKRSTVTVNPAGRCTGS